MSPLYWLFNYIFSGLMLTLSAISIVGFISVSGMAIGVLKTQNPNSPQFLKMLVGVVVFVCWGLLMVGLHMATGFPFWLRWLEL